MQILATLTQSDIFPNIEDDRDTMQFENRLTGKAIIFDELNRVALVGNKVNPYFLLPGGGIDVGETIEEGIIRECLEEVGWHVQIETPIGIVDYYRNRDKKHYITHCFVVHAYGNQVAAHREDDEIEAGMHITWKPLKEAIALFNKQILELEKGNINFYNTAYNMSRDQLFLEKADQILGC